jgi:inner membrane protein
MLAYTHIVFSVLLGIYFIDLFPIKNSILFIIFLIFFSILPDIDSRKSKLGKKLGFISTLINLIFGHRNIFHSLIFIIPLFSLLSLFSPTIALAFLLATSSHLILDALTPQGIAPFYPLKYRIKGFIKTNSLLEKLLFFIFVLLIIFKLSTGHI